MVALTKSKSADDGSQSLDAVAAALGITMKRLRNWMDDNEWIAIGDFGDTPYPERIEEFQHLKVSKRGEIVVTTAGFQVLREAMGQPVEESAGEVPDGPAAPGEPATTSEIPF